MEFQEAVRLATKKENKGTSTKTAKTQNGGRWRISFHWPKPQLQLQPEPPPLPPKEFLCPISGSLMYDPVIVCSGHTFERVCVQACKALGFTPPSIDSTAPDFSAVIPNLALKTTILNWCRNHSLNPPKALDLSDAENLVRTKTDELAKLTRPPTRSRLDSDESSNAAAVRKLIHAEADSVTMLTRPRTWSHSGCSDESLNATSSTPRLRYRYSSASSSSETEVSNPEHETLNAEHEELLTKLKSSLLFEIEETLISLRNDTRAKEETRTQMCTSTLLSVLCHLINSRYTNIQVNAVACLVNMSLEKSNKVKIVRSGIVPVLIDVLKGGFPEAQEHASSAIFSLALDDHNKTAIGVLGALPPLLHLLRSESESTRHDSALALYHLSLVQSNRTKLIKLGSVPVLLGMVESGHMRSRVLLILGNVASCADGRAVVLDSGGVKCLVSLLRETELSSESTPESCVSVLYELSHGGLRFKALAEAVGAAEVLSQVIEKSGSHRSREKAKRVLEVIKRKEDEDEEEIDWEELLNWDSISTTRSELGGAKDESRVNSSETYQGSHFL